MHTLIIDSGRAPVEITVQRGECAFGGLWLASTPSGICQLELVMDDNTLPASHSLARRWPESRVVYSSQPVDAATLLGQPQTLHIRGTAFQQQVWSALLAIPDGQTRTYGEIATAIGRPKAFRAVGSAVGKNPVAILIPCHRVLAANGQLGGFYWGPAMKRRLLAAEGVILQ